MQMCLINVFTVLSLDCKAGFVACLTAFRSNRSMRQAQMRVCHCDVCAGSYHGIEVPIVICVDTTCKKYVLGFMNYDTIDISLYNTRGM